MTQFILLLRGLPGSGKTTWAREYLRNNPDYCRVSKDDLRVMLDNGVYDTGRERLVRYVQDHAILEALWQFRDVIIDDTNLYSRDVRRAQELAKQHQDRACVATHVVPVVFETPLDECIRRDAQRERPVGEATIRKMAAPWYYEINTLSPKSPGWNTIRAGLEQIDARR